MSLKKILKSNGGQILVEYFVLVTVLLALTIVASSGFFTRAQQMTEDFTNRAINRMVPPAKDLGWTGIGVE